MTFVKVVEGSEIYNLPIHHLVHFYSIFLEFYDFKQGYSGMVSRQPMSRRDVVRWAHPRARASPTAPRLGPPATLGFRVHARLPRPRASSTGRPAPLDALKFPPLRAAPDRPVRPLLPSCARLPRWPSCYGWGGRCPSSEA
jgi:hypothetical protein